MTLTDIVCKNTKPADKTKKIADEKGLYLEITPKGRKYWRMKFRFANKENKLSFGVYPEIFLAEAREKRDEAKKMLKDGIDPSQAKKDIKLLHIIAVENSFEKLARE
jgi:hypothetical protein